MSGGSQAPMRVVLGVSGSVAAIKFTELMGELGALDASVEVKVVLTESARRFVSDAEIAEVKRVRGAAVCTPTTMSGPPGERRVIP